jgi:hypothetical protein
MVVVRVVIIRVITLIITLLMGSGCHFGLGSQLFIVYASGLATVPKDIINQIAAGKAGDLSLPPILPLLPPPNSHCLVLSPWLCLWVLGQHCPQWGRYGLAPYR